MNQHSDCRTRRGFTTRVFRLFLLVITGAVILPAIAMAQPPADPMSASLARRLAEAADGLRDGRIHWIVAGHAPPHEIYGILGTRDSAAALALLNPGSGFFGPFETPIDFGLTKQVVLLGCIHRDKPIPSNWRVYCPARSLFYKDLIDLSLVAITATDTVRFSLLHEGADAVFLTASSIRKFVVPYYTQLYGPRYASALWDSVAAGVRVP